MSLIELACHDKSCAPPPVGTGGSSPSAGTPTKDSIIEDVVRTTSTKEGRKYLVGKLGEFGNMLDLDDPEQIWYALRRTTSARVGISLTLRDPEPVPFMIDLLRYEHSLVEEEMGDSTWDLSREQPNDLADADPFSPSSGPYQSMLRKTKGGGTGVTSWWAPDAQPLDVDPTMAPGRQFITVGADRILGRIGDMAAIGEVLVAKDTDVVARLKSGTFPLVPPEALVSSLIELACHDASCAPPPTGTGGSKPGTGIKAAFDPKLGRTTITNDIREIYEPYVQDYVETAELLDAEERLGDVHNELADLFESYEEVGDHDIWAKLTESVETREMISKALKSDDPHPIAVAAMQQVHREMVAEMGGERWEFRRRAGQDVEGLDPFSPHQGKYAVEEQLRDYRSRGGTGVTSWFAKKGQPYRWDSVVDWESVKDGPPMPFEKDTLQESVRKTIWSETFGADQVIGRIGDMAWREEVLIAHTPETVSRLMSNTFPIVPRESLVSALIDLACHSEECAPPPVGTGGSSPTTDTLPEGFITEAGDSAERIFNFEFTDRNGRKFVAKTDEIEEGDSGVVTVMGTIFAEGPRVKGRRRPTTVGYFTREIDGWRMHHDSLSVMPQHQGKGIGSAFIAESMRRAADEGVTLVDTQATSSKSSNGVYTWLRAGFDTPTGMVSAGPTRKGLGRRFELAGDLELAARLAAGPVPTKDLLASPVAKAALGQAPKQMITMSLQMDISDLKTEAALAASAFTDWIERAITFTLSEDETWYEPLAELTAAGCQSADCAPPPTGTGGSKPVPGAGSGPRPKGFTRPGRASYRWVGPAMADVEYGAISDQFAGTGRDDAQTLFGFWHGNWGVRTISAVMMGEDAPASPDPNRLKVEVAQAAGLTRMLTKDVNAVHADLTKMLYKGSDAKSLRPEAREMFGKYMGAYLNLQDAVDNDPPLPDGQYTRGFGAVRGSAILKVKPGDTFRMPMSSFFVGDSVGLRGDHATSIQPFQRMTKDSTAVAVVIEGRPRGVKFNVMDLQGKERGIYPDEAIVAGQFEVVSVEEVPTGSDVPVTRVVRVRPSDAAIQASAFVDPFACHDAACAPPPVGTGGSKSVTVYHLTDDPKFAPRADFVPEDNTVTIRERTSPGLYVAKDSWDIEKWVNGSGYLRPYVAEISVPEDAMTDERWGGEGFIPGENLGRVEVKRLLPIDAFARETYGDYGWVEDTLGAKFDTGEPVPTDNSVRYAEGGRPVGYIYDGPDVRDMPAAETERLAKDAEKALGIRTGTTASADPFAGLEVYGFACRSKECAPPPVGKGGSSPGVGTSAEALFDLAAAHMKQPTKPGSIWGATDAKVELKRQLGLIFDHSIKYGYQSKVGWINPLGDRAISVHGNIFSKKGKEVGSFKFVLFKDDSGMWADFDIITLKNEYLGKGIGGRFYVRAEEGLRNAGFNRIELHAANNLGHQLGALRGASAWGRFGFDWDPRHLGDVVELRRKEARALSPSYVATGTGPREHYQIAVRFDEFADRIQAARQSGETYTLRDDDPTPAEVFELAGIKYADNIGWHGVKQLTSPATTAAASPSRQARLDAIAAFYMAAARDAETDELPDMPDTLLAACHDASCAPPPVGTGGSSPGVDHGPPYADIEGIANGHDYATYHEELMREGDTVQILDAETATYAQAQVQDAEVVVRITTDRLSDIINYSEPEDWELRSLHDPENEVGRSLREETYLQHRDVYDSAVGFDLGHVVHGYSEAEFRLDPVIPEGETSPYGHLYHRASPRGAAWYGEIQLVMTDEARDDATFTVSDSLNSGSVPLPIEGPIDPRAAALNGVHRHNFGNAYVEVQLRAPIELSSKYVKEIRVPDLYTLQDVSHVLVERMPDTIVTIEDDGIQMSMKNAVKALEEIS